ncbi:MAG: hypothetical protein E7638_02855 [Ruminococcaceae bacterium]|nr:hypothetical protein [Oscillospiraceae bacterium]
MVLDQKQTTVAYRCPECGAAVMSMVGVFALSADMIRLKCPCGGSEMEIVYTKDKKVRLNVPCFACPGPHSYMISSQMFFEKELFSLPCAYSGLDVCFVGKSDNVQKAMEKAEEELMELLGEADFSDLAANRGETRELSDPQILDIIYYVIKELEEENAISCACPDGGDYEAEMHDDHLTIRCKQCGCKAEIPTNSLIAAQDFLNCDDLELT